MDRTLRDKLLASLQAFWPVDAPYPPLKPWVGSLVTREALFSRAEQLFNGGQWERIWTGAVSAQDAPVSPWVGWSVLQTMLGPSEVQPHTWPQPASRGIPIQGGTLWVDLHEPRRVKPCCCQGSSAAPTRIAPRRKLPDAATLRWVDSSGRQRRTLNVPSYQALGGLLRAHLPSHASNSTWRQLSDELMRFQKRADQLGMDAQVSGPRESQASILRSQPASMAGRQQSTVESTDCSCTTVAVSQPCCATAEVAAPPVAFRQTSAASSGVGSGSTRYQASEFYRTGACPDEDQPASAAGLMSDGESCCMLPEELSTGTRTIFHVAEGASGSGTRSNPGSIQTAQYWLSQVTEYSSGLTILFRRGDKWTYKDDAFDPLSSTPGSLLTIRASGTVGQPIYIGAYTDPDNPSQVPPKFFGDGEVNPPGCSPSACTIVRGARFGIRISGGRYIQIQDIQITNFGTGVSVASFYDGTVITSGKLKGTFSPGYPTLKYPVRGARHVTLRQLEVYENWRDGISISSDIEEFTSRYYNNVIRIRSGGRLINTGQVVVGDGTVELKVRNKDIGAIERHGVPVEDNWWVSEVCVENCRIFANGDGKSSNGGNISLLSLASLCTFRHNEIYGAVHSQGWPNACGQIVLGYGGSSSSATYNCLWDRELVEPDLLYTWGTDGITFTTGGCGNVIENNIIRDHVFGQANSGNCGTDDGNGIDIKASGNRTYWESVKDGSGVDSRQLMDLPNVIRNNVLKNNYAVSIILHFGCRNIHIYNNEIAYNYDGAIEIRAGSLSNAQWEHEYTATADAGPAMMDDIYIYRNMIYRNGFINIGGTDIVYQTYIEDTLGICNTDELNLGRNAIYILSVGAPDYHVQHEYHGSYNNIWIANNTISNNYWYGISIDISFDESVPFIDNSTYYAQNINVLNNILYGNTGVDMTGAQIKIEDELSLNNYGVRGYLCGIQIDSNCYYNTLSAKASRIIASYQRTNLTASLYFSLTDSILLSPTGTATCLVGPFEMASLEVDPFFRSSSSNDYRLSRSSMCTPPLG
jgi:hypothetical protein